jgi:hypothetical protein
MSEPHGPTGATSSRLWRTGRFLFVAIAVLIAIAVMLGLFENWRGRRHWKAFQQEWNAKGERFDIASIIPATPPPEQNFATSPQLVPLPDYQKAGHQPLQWHDPSGNARARALADPFKSPRRGKTPGAGQWQSCQPLDLLAWREFLNDNPNFVAAAAPGDPARDVLAALGKFDTELEEITAASSRPFAVFPIHYQENVQALLPHLATLKGISQIVRLRAVARLAAGQNTEALSDAKLGLRLADALKAEPLLISQLVRMSMLQIGLQAIWESLAHHRWNEAQLAEIQSELARVRVLEDYRPAIRGERALANAAIDDLRTGRLPLSVMDDVGSGAAMDRGSYLRWIVPDGWFFENQVTLNRLYQERCLPLVDATEHRVNVSLARDADNAPELKSRGLHNIFAQLLFPAVSKSALKFAHGQTMVDLATVGCALERFRSAHGSYPEQLEALVPRYIERIPVDVITGGLLRYQRTPAQQFVLYSVGWNETDDAGTISVRKPGDAPDPKDGDWVWAYELP